MLLPLQNNSIKFLLILLVNLTIWLCFYVHLTEQPLILKFANITLPRSFINDSLHYGMALNAVIFYINYFVLVNKYMTLSISRYITVSGCFVLLITFSETLIDAYVFNHITNDKLALFTMLLMLNLSVHIVFWLVSATLKTSINWITQERLKNVLDSQRINAELNLLKSQIHPHFLFNTLNTLYSSAYQSGASQTADGIGKLSHLLRYMLYETGSNKVDLEKEVEYLENYIELQQMRFANEVDVSFVIEGEINGFKLAPMLLITLVENAFKHGISPAIKTHIKILLVIKNEAQLTFTVENTKLSPRKHHFIDGIAGGMGIKNLHKRLVMLYPKKHSFITKVKDEKFIASLELA